MVMKLRVVSCRDRMRLASISSARGERWQLAEREHHPLQLGHVERRRRALPRDVGDEDAQPVLVERQEVVVVAADLARRLAMAGEREAGIRSGPCGSSDIWISRAILSSCSSRSFSAFCCSRSSMLAVIELNESASSPS